MKTKPYPEPPFASRAPSASDERVVAESEGAAVAEPQASASPVFRSHLKYIDIPPELLAEMKAKPLPRMPTSELYSTQRFEVPPKSEASARTSQAEAGSASVSAVPGEEEQARSQAVAQPSLATVPSARIARPVGALILCSGLLLGGYWVTRGQGSERTQSDAPLARTTTPPAASPSRPDEDTKLPTEPTPSVAAGEPRAPATVQAPRSERPSQVIAERTSKTRAHGTSPAESSGATSASPRSGESSAEPAKGSPQKKPKKWFDLE